MHIRLIYDFKLAVGVCVTVTLLCVHVINRWSVKGVPPPLAQGQLG